MYYLFLLLLWVFFLKFESISKKLFGNRNSWIKVIEEVYNGKIYKKSSNSHTHNIIIVQFFFTFIEYND